MTKSDEIKSLPTCPQREEAPHCQTIPLQRPVGVARLRQGSIFCELFGPSTNHLVSVLSTDGSASHPVTAVNWCLVIVDHDAATHNRCFPAEGQVGVCEEGLGACDVSDPARHGKVGMLVLQVSHLAPSLPVFFGT